MNTYLIKLKYIIPTFLTITFTSVIGLAFLRSIFLIEFSLVDLGMIAVAFPLIPILIWLRPRLRVLSFKSDNERGRRFFQFITWIMMVGMIVASQSYIVTETGKLETLRNAGRINKRPKVKYYKLSEFEVASFYGGSYSDINVSGKYRAFLNFDIYFVAPILSNRSEKIISVPNTWYGVKFHRQISNNLSMDEKGSEFNTYYKECIAIMNNYNFHLIDHFENISDSEDSKLFLRAVESRIKQPADENIVVLVPIYKPYGERNGNTLIWTFGIFAIGLCVFLLSLTWPDYKAYEYKKSKIF